MGLSLGKQKVLEMTTNELTELLERCKSGYKPDAAERRALVAFLADTTTPEEMAALFQVSERTIWNDKRMNNEASASEETDPLTKMRLDHEQNIKALDESLAACKPGSETFMRTVAERADVQRKFQRDYAAAQASNRGSKRSYEFICILPDAVDATPRTVEVSELADFEPFIVDGASIPKLTRVFLVPFDSLTKIERELISNLPDARLVI